MKPIRVLFVEDDADFANVITGYLQESGMTVVHTASGAQALALARTAPCDVCILDIGLPDGSGFDICGRLRKITACPILMLTALESEEAIIRGLQAGADDYVVKPCSLRVLHTRIHSLLRRSDWTRRPDPQRLFSGELEIDLQMKTILQNGEPLAVSELEFLLCETLVRGGGRILTRSFLLDQLCRRAEPVEDNTLTVYISRLRRKLGTWAGTTYIDTAPGIGYRWNVEIRRLLQ